MSDRRLLLATPYLADIEADIAALEQAVADLQAQIVIIQGQITVIQNDITVIEGDITSLEDLAVQDTFSATFTVDDARWTDPQWSGAPTIPANNDFFNVVGIQQSGNVYMYSNDTVTDGIQDFLRSVVIDENTDGMNFTHNIPAAYLPMGDIAGLAVTRFRRFSSAGGPNEFFANVTFTIRADGTATFYIDETLLSTALIQTNFGFLEGQQGFMVSYPVVYTLP